MKLICFLSYGYPTIAQSIEIAEQYVQAGCDVLEIDLPSSDPYLEGEYIAARMKAALEQCSDYRQYMAGIAPLRRSSCSAMTIRCGKWGWRSLFNSAGPMVCAA